MGLVGLVVLTWQLVRVDRVGRVDWGTARSWLTGLAGEQLGAGGGGLGFGGASLTEGQWLEGCDGGGAGLRERAAASSSSFCFSDTAWLTGVSAN